MLANAPKIPNIANCNFCVHRCSKCFKVFKSEEKLSRHYKRMHDKNIYTPWQNRRFRPKVFASCQILNRQRWPNVEILGFDRLIKVLVSKEKLSVHVELIHSSEKITVAKSAIKNSSRTKA